MCIRDRGRRHTVPLCTSYVVTCKYPRTLNMIAPLFCNKNANVMVVQEGFGFQITKCTITSETVVFLMYWSHIPVRLRAGMKRNIVNTGVAENLVVSVLNCINFCPKWFVVYRFYTNSIIILLNNAQNILINNGTEYSDIYNMICSDYYSIY